MQTMLIYMADTLSGKFKNVKNMMMDTIENEMGKWYRAVNGYRNELGISWEDLQNLDKPSLKKLVKTYDTSEWEKGMVGKVSLRFYIQEKSNIKYEHCYRNNANSLFLARARTNSIKLEEHKGRGIAGYDKTCKICKENIENIVHFLIDCKELEKVRDYNLINRDIQNSEERMRNLLFKDNRFQEIGNMIKNLWNKRRYIIENNKKKKEKTLDKTIKNLSKQNQGKRDRLSDPGPGREKYGYLRDRARYKSSER